MGTGEKDLEQVKQTGVKARIQSLRAEGKTYREIAEIEHVSIAQISRILNESNQKKEEMTSSQQKEDFKKRVFRMFNKGLPPNRIIAILGRTKEVLGLWEEYKKILKDDYSTALSKIREYGFYEPGSGCPLTDALVRTFEAYFELEKRLRELDGTVKVLRWSVTKKDETIGALKTENAELQKLRQFQTMAPDEIERRKAIVRRLADTEWSMKTELSTLNQQIEAAQSFLCILYANTREAVKRYLTQMDPSEIVKIAIEAEWLRVRQSLLASVLNAPPWNYGQIEG